MNSDPGIGAGASAPWYRVVAIPDVSYGGSAERDYASVLPALLDARQNGRTFVSGWLSRGGGAPLELLTNAGPLPPPAGSNGQREPLAHAESPGGRPKGDEHPYGPPAESPTRPATGVARPGRTELLFPWGARGVLSQDTVMADLDAMVWAPCQGRQAPPSADLAARRASLAPSGPSQASGGVLGAPWLGGGAGLAAPTLFETALTTLMGRPFGWLVIAEPADSIDAEIADLRTNLTVLRRFDEEQSRFDADRAASRLAELDAFHEAGLWQVRVLVGAADAEQLSVLAPMLVGSVDLAAHPYRLRGPWHALDLAGALATTSATDADGSGVPFAATAGVLAALAGLPRREVPGVRLLDVGYFDVTVEPSGENEVSVGTILDGQDRPVGELGVPLATLNRHALVTGATGSGKSQTVRHLLEQLTKSGVPWLVVEPVKSEYAAMAGRIAP
ncbi:MAG: helicase HerA-like domain-containing protein, partial [Streptosporangiaceae bacterium]